MYKKLYVSIKTNYTSIGIWVSDFKKKIENFSSIKFVMNIISLFSDAVG